MLGMFSNRGDQLSLASAATFIEDPSSLDNLVHLFLFSFSLSQKLNWNLVSKNTTNLASEKLKKPSRKEQAYMEQKFYDL